MTEFINEHWQQIVAFSPLIFLIAWVLGYWFGYALAYWLHKYGSSTDIG